MNTSQAKRKFVKMEENTQDKKSLKTKLKNGISKIISNGTIEYELQVLFLCFISSVANSLALRIVTCISSVLFFISLIIAAKNGSVTPKTKSLALRIFKYIFFLIWFVFNVLLCIDSSAWGTKTVILGLFVIILIIYFVLSFITTFFSDSLNNEKFFIVIIGLGVVSFILSEIATNYRLLLLKIAVGLLYLGFIPFYINNCFLQASRDKKLVKILMIILKGAIIIISLPFYLQWCGLQGANFRTFVSVYSAVIGGGLTLLGVAWTIRKGEEDRKKDREQLENDRKEEERKKAIPYITTTVYKPTSDYVEIGATGLAVFLDKEIHKRCEKKCYYSIQINDFRIKNISANPVIICGVILKNNLLKFETTKILEQGGVCNVQITGNYRFNSIDTLKDMFIVVNDILGNQYKLQCELSYDIKSGWLEEEYENDKYTIYGYTYSVEQVGIPELVIIIKSYKTNTRNYTKFFLTGEIYGYKRKTV